MNVLLELSLSEDYDNRKQAAHIIESLGGDGQVVHSHHVAVQFEALWFGRAFGGVFFLSRLDYMAHVAAWAEHHGHAATQDRVRAETALIRQIDVLVEP